MLDRQRLRQQLLHHPLVAVLGHGQFTDQQVARALQHLLFAERQRLRLMQHEQALQHPRHFQQGSGPHALRVLLEAVLPVGVAETLAICKKIKDLLDFAVPYHAPQPHAADVVERNPDLQAAGFDAHQVEFFYGGTDRQAADLLDDADTVVGIDNFVADVETVATNHEEHLNERRNCVSEQVIKRRNVSTKQPLVLSVYPSTAPKAISDSVAMRSLFAS